MSFFTVFFSPCSVEERERESCVVLGYLPVLSQHKKIQAEDEEDQDLCKKAMENSVKTSFLKKNLLRTLTNKKKGNVKSNNIYSFFLINYLFSGLKKVLNKIQESREVPTLSIETGGTPKTKLINWLIG